MAQQFYPRSFSAPAHQGPADAASLTAQAAQGASSPYMLNGLPSDGRNENAVDLANLLDVLRRRFILILSTVILGTGAIAFLSYSFTPVYTASSEVLLEAPKTKVVNVESVLQDTTQDITSLIETRIKYIESRSFAREIMQTLGLLNDPEFNKTIDSGVEPGLIASTMSSLFGEASVSVSAAASTVTGFESQEETPAEKAIVELAIEKWQDGLDVKQSGASLVVEIEYTSVSPEKSALIANMVAEAYVNNQLTSQQTATSHAANWLNKRIADLRQKLVDSEKAIEDYRRDNQLFNSKGVMDQRLASLNQQLSEVQAQHAQKVAELDQLKRRYDAREGGLEAIANIVQSPIIVTLRQLEAELLRQRAQLAEEFGPKHPKRIELDLELANITDKVRVEIGHIIDSVESEIRLIEVRENKIKDDLAKAQELSLESNRSEVQLAFLQRDVDANRELYTAFLGRYKELGQQEDLLKSNASIISTAAIPDEPSFPRPKLMIIAGFVGSMVIGSILALFRDMLDRGLKSPRQIENLFGVPVLGMVPKVSLPNRHKRMHEYLLERPNSVYAEAISTVEIALRLGNDDKTKVILVTSSLPDEGKTTLAYSLATSLARSKKSTILVDLDLRNPSVFKQMSMPQGKAGLIDLMCHQAIIGDVIQQAVDSPNLDVIANAAPAHNATDIVSSPMLGTLISELRRDYEYVVLDSAPLVGIVDTRLIAPLADTALLTIRWGKTQDDAVETALRTLRSSNVKSINTVLTQVNMTKMQRMHYGDAAGKYHKKYKKYYHN